MTVTCRVGPQMGKPSAIACYTDGNFFSQNFHLISNAVSIVIEIFFPVALEWENLMLLPATRMGKIFHKTSTSSAMLYP